MKPIADLYHHCWTEMQTAIDEIERKGLTDIADHLRKTIVGDPTSGSYSYQPERDPDRNIKWDFGDSA